ncbi:MAG: hypothetical protein HY001_01630 [Candidatus Portnoybacteria bacterium]|nr:hypothetical protein [Candidatus Portnoybacteria bacterium]
MRKTIYRGFLGVLFLFSYPLSLFAQVVIKQPPAYFFQRQRLPKTAIEAAVEMAHLGILAETCTSARRAAVQLSQAIRAANGAAIPVIVPERGSHPCYDAVWDGMEQGGAVTVEKQVPPATPSPPPSP